MNGKWWKYAIIGIVLFDLCLFFVGVIPLADGGMLAVPWGDGVLALHNVSFDGFLKTHLMQNITAAAVLLTMTLS